MTFRRRGGSHTRFRSDSGEATIEVKKLNDDQLRKITELKDLHILHRDSEAYYLIFNKNKKENQIYIYLTAKDALDKYIETGINKKNIENITKPDIIIK